MTNEADAEELQRLEAEYKQLMHAMQSGVAMYSNKTDQEPKHLRVGVNSALISVGAVAELLVQKGIITRREYYEMLIVLLKQEVTRYGKLISAELGDIDVKLH